MSTYNVYVYMCMCICVYVYVYMCMCICVCKVAKRTHLNRLGPTIKNPCWKKATESQKLDYRDELCRKLQDINIPLSITNCHDVLCKNELHQSQLMN